MTGKRVHALPHKLQPGEYSFVNGVWYARSPNGLLANLAHHRVVEHEDGTITVAPSILVRGADEEYHGFLERGIWRKA